MKGTPIGSCPLWFPGCVGDSVQNPQQCFYIDLWLMQHTCTTKTLTLHQWVHIAMYHSRFSRWSVMKIYHSMRMPWVKCSISSDQYCIQPHIEATTMHHQLYMINSCILEHRSNYSFDIVMSMGIPTSSIYMSHIICISPIVGNQC